MMTVDRGTGNTLVWILQVILALIIISAGLMKFGGGEDTVKTFSDVGIGQWFRYFTGVVEVVLGLGLLVPRLCGLAATFLVPVMAGATFAEIALLEDGRAWLPIALLILAAAIAWFRRDRTARMIADRTTRPHGT